MSCAPSHRTMRPSSGSCSQPIGTQADSPLQRAWTSWLESGRSERSTVIVRGAASSSRRAAKRKLPVVIRSTGGTLRRLPSRGAGQMAVMDTWLIIVIAVAAVLVVAVALWALSRSRNRRHEERRVEAGEHREKAELQSLRAREREQAAQDELERAQTEREAAQAHVRRADELDPDVEASD